MFTNTGNRLLHHNPSPTSLPGKPDIKGRYWGAGGSSVTARSLRLFAGARAPGLIAAWKEHDSSRSRRLSYSTVTMKRAFGACLAVVTGAGLPPVTGALLIVGAPASLWGASLFLPNFGDGIIATLLSTAIDTAVFTVASMTSSAVLRRREALTRRRFEQYLAPAVVRRIFEAPTELKLSGERREVTALFTDVEGFTATMRHSDPAVLVATLDKYFEGMATIIVEHGGMIDKIVGDAVHAFFNAPMDLEDHSRKAVECAIALRSWAEVFRRRPEVATIGFGRTRIGIETGGAIVGDVGIHAKLDYTAHGDAVNVAARLEQANKELGSSICIGPLAASRCNQSLLRPLGKIIVHGRDGVMEVFEPWHYDAPKAWRESYLAAINLYDQDPIGAADFFDQLAADQIDDPVARSIASRMRTGKWRKNGSVGGPHRPTCRVKGMGWGVPE
jgi:adenylate cyclase